MLNQKLLTNQQIQGHFYYKKFDFRTLKDVKKNLERFEQKWKKEMAFVDKHVHKGLPLEMIDSTIGP